MSGVGGVADGDYGETKPSLLQNHPLAPWLLSFWRIFILKAVIPQLFSMCFFEQDSYKLIFYIVTINGENNGFGIWSVHCETLAKLGIKWDIEDTVFRKL